MTSTESNARDRSRLRRLRWAAIVPTAVLALAACGGAAEPAADSAGASAEADSDSVSGSVPIRFTVVTSDPPLADLVSVVAGDGVEVVSVVPMGADGHTYEPVPSDARLLAEADIYIENGMGLNDVVSEFASTNYPDGTPHYALADVVPDDEVIYMDSAEQIAAHGHAHMVNAHFWPDPGYAMLYVGEISRILSSYDPDNAAGYQQRTSEFTAALEDMDQAFETALATIPEENRKLVVYHDSWSYYGKRYGIPVVGAIQPTDFAEPSAAEVRATIEQVREEGVPAFFGSEVFPSGVLSSIEYESGAKYVADLSDDAFPGEPGTPEHSYMGMMLANTRTIVTALGGVPTALDSVQMVP